MRFIALGRKSFWLDEASSVAFSQFAWPKFLHVMGTGEANMGFYYLCLHGWLHVADGDTEIRLLSVLPGVLSIPVMLALGTKLFSQRVGIFSALLLTVNACAVVYSQEARGYSMLLLFSALSCLYFLRICESGRWLDCAAYVVFTVLAFYCHFFSVLVVAAQWCALVVLPARAVPWRRLILCAIAILSGMAPGIYVIFASHGNPVRWVAKPNLLEFYHLGVFLAAEGGKRIGAALFGLCLALLVYASIQTIQKAKTTGDPPTAFRSLFPLFWLIVPIVLSLLLSVWKPVFFHRFLIICLFPFLLLVSAGINFLSGAKLRRIVSVTVVVLSLITTILSYTRVREDWRTAVRWMLDKHGGDDLILRENPDAGTQLAYYRGQFGAPLNDSQVILIADPPTPHEVQLWAATHPHLWLIVYPYPQHAARQEQIRAALQSYVQCESRSFTGISVTYYSTQGCASQ